MDRKQQEDVARAFLDALGRCDTETMSDLSTEDMTWWIMPGNKFSGLHAKDSYLKNLPELLKNASGPLKLVYHEITGENDRLAVVAKGDLPMKDGRHYRNDYHFLLRFRDGKIASGKEFTDSLHINEIFGAPDRSDAA
ncbi:nuclear transport factor 2 family protein [Rhizobium sp.]|uniref:nuclear transport factor 2 family protein n=1 Tax=Rhizobium sp. TaxID=391 RepID=UPI00289FD9EA